MTFSTMTREQSLENDEDSGPLRRHSEKLYFSGNANGERLSWLYPA